MARKTARPRAQFTDDIVKEAVRTYVQGLSSYRVLSTLLEDRLGRTVSRFTLNNWVHELGEQAKTPLEVSSELHPKWGGFLGIDGKAIYVRSIDRATATLNRLGCAQRGDSPSLGALGSGGA